MSPTRIEIGKRDPSESKWGLYVEPLGTDEVNDRPVNEHAINEGDNILQKGNFIISVFSTQEGPIRVNVSKGEEVQSQWLRGEGPFYLEIPDENDEQGKSFVLRLTRTDKET